MTEHLKSCPFCGDGEELRIEADNACKCPCYFWVVCGSCGGRMVAEGERGAIAAWNARPSPLVDTGEALREALSAAGGYLRNAKIDLETGATKATAIRTIEGGLKRIDAALAAHPKPEEG